MKQILNHWQTTYGYFIDVTGYHCHIKVAHNCGFQHFPVLPLFISYTYNNGMKQMLFYCSTSCDYFRAMSGHHSNSI